MESDLHLRQVVYAYAGCSGRPALDGLTVRIPNAASVALIGENGAGKSTVCKVLNGIHRHQAGTISLGSETICPAAAPGRYVAYAFQHPDDQLFLQTVRDELAFGPRNLGMNKQDVKEAVAWTLDLFRIADVADAHPLDLPFVLRKRVSMAAAVAMQRPWTVLDEPTLGQAPRYCSTLLNITRTILEAGRGIVIISHDPEFIFDACDQVIAIASGRCLWSGTREDYLCSRDTDLDGFMNIPSRLMTDLGLPRSCATRTGLVSHFRGR